MTAKIKSAPTAAIPSKIVYSGRGKLILEKRREARYPTSDPAEIQILPATEPRVPATVLDVSRSGLRVELKIQVASGMRIEIILADRVIIFGEIRYCRRAGSGYHAGVLIHDVVRPRQQRVHIHDDLLSLYLVGKGLTVPEVIRIKDHLIDCDACRIRLAETDAILHPRRRR